MWNSPYSTVQYSFNERRKSSCVYDTVRYFQNPFHSLISSTSTRTNIIIIEEEEDDDEDEQQQDHDCAVTVATTKKKKATTTTATTIPSSSSSITVNNTKKRRSSPFTVFPLYVRHVLHRSIVLPVYSETTVLFLCFAVHVNVIDQHHKVSSVVLDQRILPLVYQNQRCCYIHSQMMMMMTEDYQCSYLHPLVVIMEPIDLIMMWMLLMLLLYLIDNDDDEKIMGMIIVLLFVVPRQYHVLAMKIIS